MTGPSSPTPRPDAAEPGVGWRFAPLLVVAAAWLAFFTVYKHGWVLDDVRLVRDNAEVARGPAAIPDILAGGHADEMENGTYGPVARASFALEAPLWRRADGTLRATGFHLTNLLLHGLCALLLFQVLVRLAPGRPVLALGTALVFAVHPVHAGTVAPLMGRAVLLAALCSLLAVKAWRAWAGGRQLAWLPVALVLWLLAVLSHEAALGLPLVLWLLDRFVPADPATAGRPAARYGVLAFAVPCAAFLAVWPGVAQTAVDLPVQGLGTRLVLGAEGFVRLVLSLVVPVGLRGDHGDEALPGVGFGLDAGSWASLAAIVVVSAALLLRVRRGRGGALALAWFAALSLALAAAAALPAGRTLETRWGYVVGLALVPVAGLLAEALARAGRGRVSAARLRAAAAGAVAIILLVGLAQRETRAWRDDDVFHEHLLARNPTHIRAMVRLARTQRLTAEALRGRAAVLRANDVRRAAFLEERRQALSRAELWAQRAAGHELGRESARAWRELGLMHLASDRSAEALRALERSRELDPVLRTKPSEAADMWSRRRAEDAAELYFAIGRAREALGYRETAADAFLMAATFEPRRVDYLLRAGMALCRVNRYAEGIGLLEQSLRMTTESTRRDEIQEHIENARRSARRIAQDLINRGIQARDESQMGRAVTLFEQAIEVNPDSVEARIEAGRLRGWWYGYYESAEASFREAEAILDRKGVPPDDERRRRIAGFRRDLAEQRAREDAEERAAAGGG